MSGSWKHNWKPPTGWDAPPERVTHLARYRSLGSWCTDEGATPYTPEYADSADPKKVSCCACLEAFMRYADAVQRRRVSAMRQLARLRPRGV